MKSTNGNTDIYKRKKKNLHRFVSTHIFIETKMNEIRGRMLHNETKATAFFL